MVDGHEPIFPYYQGHDFQVSNLTATKTSLHSLVPDMYQLLKSKGGWFSDELRHLTARDIASRFQSSLNSPRDKNTLRLSQMGPKCPRHLWNSIHNPELAAPLPPWTVFKYAYGHSIEALAITVARASGHEVTGEQDEVVVDDIIGHRDCVIDGAIFDVKSSSSRGMEKFEKGTLWQDDSFGYLDQLDGYVCGSLEDPLVRIKDRAYILAIDLTLGHMAVYEHKVRIAHILSRVADHKRIVGLASPPECRCVSVADGESGNLKLDVKASYSPFRYVCHPGLRTFIYSKGPVYFTRVMKRPMYKGVPLLEIDQFGHPV